jgi:hypothetical protein
MELESDTQTPIKLKMLNTLDENGGNSLTTFSFATIPILLLYKLHFCNPLRHLRYTRRDK